MRNLYELDQHRQRHLEMKLYGVPGDHLSGVFAFKSKIDGVPLRVIAANGDGWDHVSVSRHNRCPNWAEMRHMKEMFFFPEEAVMQLHVPAKDHVNFHPYCLHLWRPHYAAIPLPPSIMVGPKTSVPA